MISGRYVRTFAEANMGMLEGASLNAPYKFHWIENVECDGEHIRCTGGGEAMRLRVRRTRAGDRATVTVQDPIFGPIKFQVAPFKGKQL